MWKRQHRKGPFQNGCLRPGYFNANGVSKDYPMEIFLKPSERKARILDCGYSVGQSWGALDKLWNIFLTAKHSNNFDMMQLAAAQIQKIQRELGISVTPFYNLGLEVTDDELSAADVHVLDDVISLHDRLEAEKEQKQREEDEYDPPYTNDNYNYY